MKLFTVIIFSLFGSLFGLKNFPAVVWSSQPVEQPNSDDGVLSDIKSKLNDVGSCEKLNIIVWQKDLEADDFFVYENAFKSLKETTRENPSFIFPYQSEFEESIDDNVNSLEMISNYLKKQCFDNSASVGKLSFLDEEFPSFFRKPDILLLELPSFKANGYEEELRNLNINIQKVETVLEHVKILAGGNGYVFIFAGGEESFQRHGDLKKRSVESKADGKSNFAETKLKTLFEKYIFVNNGIYAGILGAIILFFTLIASINLVGSVQTPTRFEVKKKGN